jgi:hypothetical protein
MHAVEIVAALFIDDIEARQDVAAGPTKLDLSGVHFSLVPPTAPPVVVEPHLVVLVRCGADEPGTGALEVRFLRPGQDEPIARNVQPLQVEPGRFSYRLVRAGLSFDGYETVEAHCRIDKGHTIVVPLTLVPAPAG